jgi:hypothetical protein
MRGTGRKLLASAVSNAFSIPIRVIDHCYTCPVFICIEPSHEGKDIPCQSGHEAASQEEITRLGMTLVSVMDDGAYTSTDQPRQPC